MELKDWLSLILNVSLLIVTIIYVFYTKKIVIESRLSREFHLEAHLICYLVVAETNPSLVNLVIENIGNGVAKNLKGTIIKDIEDTHKPLSKIALFKNTFAFFPPNYKQKYFLLGLATDYEKRMQESFEFSLTYDDLIKKNKTEVFKIYFKDVEGLGKITPPETELGMIAYTLEKIEKKLKN